MPSRVWWQCGSPDTYHSMDQFDLDSEKCNVCGMDIEEYWIGYEREICDTAGRLRGNDAYRVRRATIGSRLAEAMHAEESEDDSGPVRPERGFLVGMGE